MFFNLGMQEMLIIGVVAVLLFGKRLPEVAKSLGGSYREFRKGLSEMQAHMQIDDTITSAVSTSSHYDDDFDDYEQPMAPKFEPPSSEPVVADEPVVAEAPLDEAEDSKRATTPKV